MQIRHPLSEFLPLTRAEIAALRKDALRPDYGGKYYKPPTVLRLIATLEGRAIVRARQVSTAAILPACVPTQDEAQMDLFG